MPLHPSAFSLAASAGGKAVGSAIVLQIYVDESGIHNDSPVVTCGAYVGTVPAWDDWTEKWNEAKGPIKVVHSADCEALRGEFAGFTTDKRNAFASKLLPIIANADITPFAVGVRMHDYKLVVKEHPELASMMGDTPYVACLQWTLQRALRHAKGMCGGPHIGIVHESNDYRGVIGDCVELLKEKHPDFDVVLSFAGKNAAPQLQAADALAYEANKRFRNIDRSKPDRTSLIAMVPERKRKPETLTYFDEVTMCSWVDQNAFRIALPDS